jgi:hypothetical protein
LKFIIRVWNAHKYGVCGIQPLKSQKLYRGRDKELYKKRLIRKFIKH